MSNARQLHREAMIMVGEAHLALQSGERERHDVLIRAAFDKERGAAWELLHKQDAEPTRSILFRSGAQLAIECGEFKEAEKLVAAALFGNPPIEILLELRELNQQIANYLEWAEILETPAFAHEYMQMLRQQALNIRVKPKNPTYGSAVILDNVIEVLRKVRESFRNFLGIDFNKSFGHQHFNNSDKLLANLQSEAVLLLSNVKFSSFAASIAPDLRVMASQYSDEISDWKSGVFNRFKTDVFLTEYNSIPELKPLTERYTDEERRLIFGPIIDLFKDNNTYNFTLTDTSFAIEERKYRPVSKPVRDILVPTVQPIDIVPNRELFQSFGLASPESGGAISKANVITTQALTTAEFRVSLDTIQFEKEELILREQIEVEIKYEKPIFSISSEILKIRTNAYDYNSVLKDFQEAFIELYQELKKKPSSELSSDELSAQAFMDSVVFTVAN